MKSFIKILILFFCSISVGQNSFETAEYFGLSGNVKTIEEITYKLMFISGLDLNGKLVEQNWTKRHNLMSFDENNLLTKEVFIDIKNNKQTVDYIRNQNGVLIDLKSNGKYILDGHFDRMFDEREKKLLTISGIIEKDLFIGDTIKSTYDKEGRISKIYYNKKSYNKLKIGYCDVLYDNNNIKSLNCYIDKGKLISTKTYDYNEYNKIEEIKERIIIGDLTKNINIQFFDKNQHVNKEIKEYYDNGKLSYSILKKFETFKEVYKATKDSLDFVLKKTDKTFDLRGNLITLTANYTKNGKFYESSERYTYDESFNIINFSKNSQDEIINNNFKYKYDTKGNWILKCFLTDSKLNKAKANAVTLRQITYHNSGKDEVLTKEEAINFCDSTYFNRLDMFKKDVEQNIKKGNIEVEEKN